MSPSDWKKSEWYKKTGNKDNENFPESCCVTKADKCSKGGNPDIYQKVSTTTFISQRLKCKKQSLQADIRGGAITDVKTSNISVV